MREHTTRPPLVGADLWSAVITAADGRCQCQGACGRRHTPVGVRTPGVQYRCEATRDLIAAPPDPATRWHEAAATPAGGLIAWCPRCHTAAVAAVRSAARNAPAQGEGLFDTTPYVKPRRRSSRRR
jgi:hypothetical protein